MFRATLDWKARLNSGATVRALMNGPQASDDAKTSRTIALRAVIRRDTGKRIEEHLLQTPGIEPGTFCAAISACVATVVRQKS